jgi:spore coat polysaccharide biosynthesis protein SpsF
MRRVLIVQARMTSTRLPGKVLMDVAGRPMLERQLQRLMRCARVDEVVLAVSTNPDDELLTTLARRLGVRWFRGSEHDVLSRYRGAASEADADLVIRVTADCPLIDPEETDTVVAALEERRSTCDYASNGLERSLPRGLETEALWRDVLERMDRLAVSPAAREHVTWFCYGERPDLFALHSVRRPYHAADLRWTVDTREDLEVIRELYAALDLADRPQTLADIIDYARRHPALGDLNAHIAQERPEA